MGRLVFRQSGRFFHIAFLQSMGNNVPYSIYLITYPRGNKTTRVILCPNPAGKEVVNNNWSLCELITVVTYGFCRIDEDTGNLDLLVEIEDESGFGIDHDLHLKVNLYNEDEEIIYSGGEYIYEDDFDGYDTVRIHMEEDGLAFNAVRCKIYMTKG